MDPMALDVIMPFLAIVGTGTMVLVGMKLRYDHKARLAERASETEDVARLTTAVDELMDEVHTLREGLADLHERMEFTERMLTRGSAADAQPTKSAD